MASVGYMFQHKYSGELKIAGKVSDNWELGIGVRNDDNMLLSVLQKAVDNISYDQKREVLNKWISIKYEKGVDYTLLYRVIAIFVLVLFIIIYFYNRQRVLKEKLEDAYKELEKVAVTDKLTGLYNRHKIDEVLEIERIRSKRYGTTFGIMILDIDYFKNINDNYGHHTGDAVLKELSNLLLSNIRESDTLGRWGGEEFMIIAPQTSKESIMKFAQDLKEKINIHKFEIVDNLTVSIGIALCKDKESIEDIVLRADDALYISKNTGRDKISYK